MRTVFQVKGRKGWSVKISLRCQVWGETSLLSVPLKEAMTSISGAHTLAITTMNHLTGNPPEASDWAQCNLSHPHDLLTPNVYAPSPQEGTYSGQVWVCPPTTSPPLGDSSRPTLWKCSFPYPWRMRYEDWPAWFKAIPPVNFKVGFKVWHPHQSSGFLCSLESSLEMEIWCRAGEEMQPSL